LFLFFLGASRLGNEESGGVVGHEVRDTLFLSPRPGPLFLAPSLASINSQTLLDRLAPIGRRFQAGICCLVHDWLSRVLMSLSAAETARVETSGCFSPAPLRSDPTLEHNGCSQHFVLMSNCVSRGLWPQLYFFLFL
jgi:hypothetical protein